MTHHMTAKDIEAREKALRDWFRRCLDEDDAVRHSYDAVLDQNLGMYYHEYRIPADRFDTRHPERCFFWDVDVYSDGSVRITDEFYVNEDV